MAILRQPVSHGTHHPLCASVSKIKPSTSCWCDVCAYLERNSARRRKRHRATKISKACLHGFSPLISRMACRKRKFLESHVHFFPNDGVGSGSNAVCPPWQDGDVAYICQLVEIQQGPSTMSFRVDASFRTVNHRPDFEQRTLAQWL